VDGFKNRARDEPVIQRFTLQDLVAQNESGVFYHAMDTTTAQDVGIRRFCPFGHDGGGLDAEEQTAYAIAIDRLAGVRHPAMRSIICGGCDPIDQMPFIVTEWIEGFSLRSYTIHESLKPPDAILILTHALEVCEVLSEIFAEEAVWIETDLDSIIIGKEGSGRGATFWISPLKWLGGPQRHEPGLAGLIQLTEEIMHWSGVDVLDHAGGGLGAWLKWLRKASATATLGQAREMLSAAVGVEPPQSVKKLVRKATLPQKKLTKLPQKKPAFEWGWVVAVLVLLLCAAGAAWWLHSQGRLKLGWPLAPVETEVAP